MTPKYRADIDGLRALAVLPVVFYHAGVSLFSGGYVGVDVFFVISGYLVGTILFTEIDAGIFSLAAFYERRARRILPAFLVCLAVTLTAGFVLLLPDDAIALGWSGVASLVFASNVWFYAQSESYFDAPAETKPLLHTWSLGVEEQFYIVFPLMLMVLARISRSSGREAGIRAICICILIAASLGLSAWGTIYRPNGTFYLLPTRFWELLVGAMLALPLWHIALPRRAAEALAAIGVASILSPVFAYGPATSYPGLAALPPVLGAALVIFVGRNAVPTCTARWLGAPPLRRVGLASYSLYLWHWPLLAFSRARFGSEPGVAIRASCVIAALALALLSWRFIEQPFRERRGLIPKRRLLPLYLCGIGFGLTLALGLALLAGIPQRLPASVRALAQEQGLRDPLQSKCFDAPKVVRSQAFCLRGAHGTPPSFLMVGDSHGEAIAGGVFRAAETAGVAGLQITQSGWRPTGAWRRTGWEREYAGKQPQLVAALAHPAIRTVVIGIYWSSALGESYHLDDSTRLESGKRIVPQAIGELIRAHSDKHFILLGDVPTSPQFGAREQANALLFARPFTPKIPRAQFDAALAPVLRAIAPLRALPNVTSIDVGEQLCDKRWCYGVRGTETRYIDADHLTYDEAQRLAPLFAQAFQPATSVVLAKEKSGTGSEILE